MLKNNEHIQSEYDQQLHFAFSMANNGKNKMKSTEVPISKKTEKKKTSTPSFEEWRKQQLSKIKPNRHLKDLSDVKI